MSDPETSRPPVARVRKPRTPLLRRIVEHVFLVDRTGTPLVHLSRRGASEKDPDLIALMVNTVQTFLNESFRSMGIGDVRSIELADYNLTFGRGQHSLLFVLYRGRESTRLERRAQDDVRAIEARFAQVLKDGGRDASGIAGMRRYLELEWALRPADERPTASPTGAATSGQAPRIPP